MNETIDKPAPVTVIAGKNEAPAKLALIEALFDALHTTGIQYCHWKSNEHLGASMTGDTDLDVLFDERQKKKLERLLADLHFKKFDAIARKQYKDIEDYIGLDNTSGKVVHLHTHYRLTMGETYLKSYQLPIEDAILESRVFDDTFGLYRIDPAFELILLYFRTALKIRNRDAFRMYVHKEIAYSENNLSEYNWLKLRVTNTKIEAILWKIIPNYLPVYALVTGDFRRKSLLKLAFVLKKELKKYRFLSPARALLLRWYREAAAIGFRKIARRIESPLVKQRINPRGGFIVAIIGADGSGKSTVIKSLQSTFGKKLDVYKVYLGNGRVDTKSLMRKLLLYSKKTLAKPKPHLQEQKTKASTEEKQSGFKATLFKCLQALVIAGERHKNLKRMQAAKKKGMLVLCDRFPQNQTPGYNDGPMLHAFISARNPLFRAMAKQEAHVYAMAQHNPPDLLIKLVADADVIQARKPSLASLEMLEAKVEGVKKLTFANSCRVVTINAMQPLEQVLFIIRKEIWADCP